MIRDAKGIWVLRMVFLAAPVSVMAQVNGTAISSGAEGRAQPVSFLPADAEIRTRVHSSFAELRASGFSGTVVVERAGHILFTGYAGEGPNAYTSHNLVPIGSLTKAITAVAILKLQDQGRLSVQDSVSRFFPGLSGPVASVTVHQLLTHSSGLPISAATNHGPAQDNEPIGQPEFLERLSRTQLLFSPGQGFEYSNAGYGLLAAVIEQASGRSYSSFVRDEVLRPAGVDQIGYGDAVDVQRIAQGRNGSRIDETGWGPGGPYWNLLGNGGIVADPQSFVRWRRAVIDRQIISPAALAAAGTPWVTQGGGGGEGYGWIISRSPTRGMVELAAGGNGESTAEMRYYRDHDLIIFTATNGLRSAGAAAARLIAAAFGEPDPAPPMPPPAVAAFANAVVTALRANAGERRAFLDANVGPRYREIVGIEEIDRQFGRIQRDLAGANFEGLEGGPQGQVIARFRAGPRVRLLLIQMGGRPEAPRIAGVVLE